MDISLSKMLTGTLPKSESWYSHVQPCKHRCLTLQGILPCLNDRLKQVNHKKANENSDGSGTKSPALKSLENYWSINQSINQ